MKPANCIILAIIATLSFQQGHAHHTQLPNGISPAKATWLWGHHSIPGNITRTGNPYWYVHPHTDVNKITNPVWSDVAKTHIKQGAKAPAVLVLHGCSGLSYGTTEYRRFFIGSGYAVFEPSSYARPGKRCGEGYYEQSFKQRVEELEHALVEIKQLNWVNQDQLIVMGVSEGGRVVASWEKVGFAGHIIIAAPCKNKQTRIPAAPKNTPVLSVIGENDDRSAAAQCQTNTHAPGSNSIVIAGAGHEISDLPEVGKAVAEFLEAIRY